MFLIDRVAYAGVARLVFSKLPMPVSSVFINWSPITTEHNELKN